MDNICTVVTTMVFKASNRKEIFIKLICKPNDKNAVELSITVYLKTVSILQLDIVQKSSNVCRTRRHRLVERPRSQFSVMANQPQKSPGKTSSFSRMINSTLNYNLSYNYKKYTCKKGDPTEIGVTFRSKVLILN